MRHERLVRSYAVTHPSGQVVLPQPPGWDHLLYAARGVMSVVTGQDTWIVPPHRAVWVPSGVDHRIIMTGRVAVRSLYLPEGLLGTGAGCRAIEMAPLLRELVLHAVAISPFDPEVPEHRRLIGVLADRLAVAEDTPLRLPVPTDPRARAVADRLLADPSGTRTLAALAREAGASRRTVERLFLAETGMPVGAWRRRARLVEALRLLASGRSVTEVAAHVGYGTPSAFTAMFRTELGASPVRYLRQHS